MVQMVQMVPWPVLLIPSTATTAPTATLVTACSVEWDVHFKMAVIFLNKNIHFDLRKNIIEVAWFSSTLYLGAR